ncbi:MAG TPA: hypothetical protein V6C72_10110 [Chroococcales cyanobacterium]
MSGELRQKLMNMENELAEVARRMLKTAGDPFSGVIRFLAERPEDTSLPGFLVNMILDDVFGDREQIPGLIRILAGHVREIARKSNVINIINEHPKLDRFGELIIKQTERINFEVGWEKQKIVLKNISGLFGIEHGIEVPLEKILVAPPKLIVTVKLGILRPQRVLDL